MAAGAAFLMPIRCGGCWRPWPRRNSEAWRRRGGPTTNARAFVGYNATADGALVRFLVLLAPVALVTLVCFLGRLWRG